MELKGYLIKRQALINEALGKYLPAGNEVPTPIHQAMRYSVLGRGKRIRPILVLAACEAVGGAISRALPAACALELIHAYSLVHDDLPAMDDDDFRRGKPSCHKKYGEAIGVLTGDALLTLSFQLLAQGNKPGGNGAATMHLQVIEEVARAIGTEGMIGGQVADVALTRGSQTTQPSGFVALTNGKRDPHLVDYVNTRKTGALLAACVRVGALLGGASPKEYGALRRYGERIGLVFQLVDDLLDQDGAVKVHGAQAVRRRAERLTQSALEVLAPLGERAQTLKALAQFIETRNT